MPLCVARCRTLNPGQMRASIFRAIVEYRRCWNVEGTAGVAGPEHSLGGQSMDRLESSETHEERRAAQVSRRSFMTQVAAGVAAAPLVGGALAGCAQTTSPSAKAGASGPSQRPPNILFLFT